MKSMESFFRSLLPHDVGNCSRENKTIDVVIKGCFDYYDLTACVRSSLLAFIGFFTFLLCVVRIARLHVLHHPQIHQYLIFYFASFEVVFLIVKWLTINDFYQMEFAASFLKMVQFILLCHFHWSLVSRILHHEKLITGLIIPLLGGFFLFFSCVTALGMLSHFSAWEECLAPHWILLSAVELLGIQQYVVAGFYITRKINSISAMDSFKREQKRDLWSVIATYEFSSLVTLIYYSSLRALGNQEIGCSGIFGHVQEIYSPIYGAFMIIKYILPIWVMLYIFYPTSGILTSEDERLLGWSGDGSTTSVFSSSTRFMHSYKQLVLPVQNEVPNEQPVLQRSFSSPAIFSKPLLTPIYEENSIVPSSRPPHISYGAVDNYQPQPESPVCSPPRSRSRHDSGLPSRTKIYQVPVSLNHCSDEMENVSSSSVEKA